MQHSDVQTLFDRDTSVILELKCYTSYVPLWMVDCVRTFQLQRDPQGEFLQPFGSRQHRAELS